MLIFFFFLIIALDPGLKILCMNLFRTVDSVHIVIIPSIIEFQTGKYLAV
jgi:hypothetical protein